MRNRSIPEATVVRLPIYLQALLDLGEGRGEMTVSSEELAQMAGVNAAKVRKDLSYLGSYGTRGVGYEVDWLQYQIKRELGLTQDWPTVIVGVGNLGRALASYKGFAEHGFSVAALVDVDESVVGATVGGLQVLHIDDLKEVVVDRDVSIGIISTPPFAAQEVADKLVDAGVKSILNFAPAMVNVPPDVTLRKVDLSTELQILSFYQLRAEAVATARAAIRKIDKVKAQS